MTRAPLLLALLVGATPDAAAHPFVVKEAAALGKTAAARAVESVATQAAWFAIGSDIEAARPGATVAVTQAKGNEAARRKEQNDPRYIASPNGAG